MSKQQKNETRIVKAASRPSQVASLTDATRQLMVKTFRNLGGHYFKSPELFKGSWLKRVFGLKQPTLVDIMKSLEGKDDKASRTMLRKLNQFFPEAKAAQEKKIFRILVCAEKVDLEAIFEALDTKYNAKTGSITKGSQYVSITGLGLHKVSIGDKKIVFTGCTGMGNFEKAPIPFANSYLRQADMVICTPDFQGLVFNASKYLDKKMTALVTNVKASRTLEIHTSTECLEIKATIFSELKDVYIEQRDAYFKSNEGVDINERIQDVFAPTNNAS